MSTKAPTGSAPRPPNATPPAGASGRIPFIDGMRGLAVLFMMNLHTAHGWLRPELRGDGRWQAITAFGGMAAPLFFLLAGVGVGVGWARRPPPPGGLPLLPGAARGLSLVCLGYLLRVQMWMIDGAAIAQPRKWPGAVALVTGYLLAYFACEQLAAGKSPGRLRWVAVLACVALGLWDVSVTEPSRVMGLLRVDVLQGIGMSLVLLHLATAAARTPRGRSLGAAALACVVLAGAHHVRASMPGPLPEPLAGYLGTWAPGADGRRMGMFPMFPWAAYAAVGALLGQHWSRVQGGRRPFLTLLGYGCAGVALAVAVRETRPDMYELLRRWPAWVQPDRVAYRVGLACALAPIAYLLAHDRSPLARPLRLLGAHSLLIYWVHLELAFGAAATPLRGRLDHGQWALGLLALSAAMCAVAVAWRRFRAHRKTKVGNVTAPIPG